MQEKRGFYILAFLLVMLGVVVIVNTLAAGTIHYPTEISVSVNGSTMDLQQAINGGYLTEDGATPTKSLTPSSYVKHNGNSIYVSINGQTMTLQAAINRGAKLCSTSSGTPTVPNFGHSSAEVWIWYPNNQNGQQVILQEAINDGVFCTTEPEPYCGDAYCNGDETCGTTDISPECNSDCGACSTNPCEGASINTPCSENGEVGICDGDGDCASHAQDGPVCNSNLAFKDCVEGSPCLRNCDAWCPDPGAVCDADLWTSNCPAGPTEWYNVNNKVEVVECCTNTDCPSSTCNTNTHTCSPLNFHTGYTDSGIYKKIGCVDAEITCTGSTCTINWNKIGYETNYISGSPTALTKGETKTSPQLTAAGYYPSGPSSIYCVVKWDSSDNKIKVHGRTDTTVPVGFYTYQANGYVSNSISWYTL